MSDFNIRADSVNVEQIMDQIRARIREKRGVDYTEQQIRELAQVKLEKMLDPRGVRPDLLEAFRQQRPPYQAPSPPLFEFEEGSLFDSRSPVLRFIRHLLRPLVKLFFNVNLLTDTLRKQSSINRAGHEREAARESGRHELDGLYFEVIHNLVFELTRLGIEVKNLKMRVESLSSRVEFNERRARALEGVVVYKPSSHDRSERPTAPEIVRADEPQAETPSPTDARAPEGPGQRSRRRRRRRGRRGGPPAAVVMGGEAAPDAAVSPSAPDAGQDTPPADAPTMPERSVPPDDRES